MLNSQTNNMKFGGKNMYFNLLWKEFATLPEIEAVALGGSRAGADYDAKSDYDLYLY